MLLSSVVKKTRDSVIRFLFIYFGIFVQNQKNFYSIVLHWQCGTNACFFQFLRKCIFRIFFSIVRSYWTRKVVLLFLALKKITKFLINVFLVLFFNFRKKFASKKTGGFVFNICYSISNIFGSE